MSMIEEQGVKYETPNARYTIRMCIMTDRMITMISIGQKKDEVVEFFLKQDFTNEQILRTWSLIQTAMTRMW